MCLFVLGLVFFLMLLLFFGGCFGNARKSFWNWCVVLKSSVFFFVWGVVHF